VRDWIELIIIMFTALCLWDHFEKQALFMCVCVCGYGSAVPVWTADEGSELLTRPWGGGPEASAESQSPSTPATLTNGRANSLTHNTLEYIFTKHAIYSSCMHLNAYACGWKKNLIIITHCIKCLLKWLQLLKCCDLC